MGKSRIRPIALGLLQHQGHIFVSKGKDTVKAETFYRFLGGGIDFGESSIDALKREFQEEIQAELTNIEYLTCLDNLFTCSGKPGHELIQLFRAQFVDSKFCQVQKTFRFVEGDSRAGRRGQRIDQALWIPISGVLSGEYRLVPASCHQYLSL